MLLKYNVAFSTTLTFLSNNFVPTLIHLFGKKIKNLVLLKKNLILVVKLPIKDICFINFCTKMS